MEIRDDLISRKAAIDYLMTNMGWHDEDGYEVDDADEKRTIITDLVNGIPSVDAVPVEWLKEQFYDNQKSQWAEKCRDVYTKWQKWQRWQKEQEGQDGTD